MASSVDGLANYAQEYHDTLMSDIKVPTIFLHAKDSYTEDGKSKVFIDAIHSLKYE